MKMLNSKGDTIVEVLIAIAVTSAMLGGAFVVVNKTLANARQAQEHGEALQIARAQVEGLKKLSESDGGIDGPLFTDGSKTHCIYLETTTETISAVPFSASVSSLPQANPSDYPDKCKQSRGSYTFLVGAIRDTVSRAGVTYDSFRVYVNWRGATDKDDEVRLTYQVYRP